ncbi:hypothetical protein U2F58_10120 [Lactobacillus johnsonii]|uniref:hypothetical protein n=1 Tax=Lactobacillus johnsonii TaxID=33959 RepID=UPI00261E7AC4
MKKKKLFLAAFLGCSIYAVSLSSNVEAQELTPQNEVSVQVYAPSKNGPLYKYVSNVYRYSAWRGGDVWTLTNTTPDKVYYNDGKYNGYLYRKGTWMEHNPKTNKTRWVSVYGGNTRLIAYGLATN